MRNIYPPYDHWIAFACHNGMGDWATRSLEPCHYHIDGEWVLSDDPHGLLLQVPYTMSCPYKSGDGQDEYLIVRVVDCLKMRPPFKPSRKHPTPTKYQVVQPGRRYMLQVHDGDDGFLEKFSDEFPHEDFAALIAAQPVDWNDLHRIFNTGE